MRRARFGHTDPVPLLETSDLVCPHCKKRFDSELLPVGGAERYRGFKCPHCRLFVPAARAIEAPD